MGTRQGGRATGTVRGERSIYPTVYGTRIITGKGTLLEPHWIEGFFCVVEEGVKIGKNCKLGHHVVLRSGTVLGDSVVLGDGVLTTGTCSIGSRTNVRTGAIISHHVYIENDVFIGPGVITNHTKHVTGANDPSEGLLTLIQEGAIIGSGAQIVAGVTIAEGVVVGAGAVVTKDLLEPGTYVGNPARRMEK